MARYANARLAFSEKTYAPVNARKRTAKRLLCLALILSILAIYLNHIGILVLVPEMVRLSLRLCYLKIVMLFGKYWTADNIEIIIKSNADVHYVPLILEGLIIMTFIWKLFFRKEIRGILRIRCVILLVFSGMWIYAAMEAFDLKSTEIYRLLADFINEHLTFSYVYIYSMHEHLYIFSLVYLMLLIFSYKCVMKIIKKTVKMNLKQDRAVSMQDNPEGKRVMKSFGFYDIYTNAKKISGRFQKMPKLYYTVTMPMNGYNIANVIVYDINEINSSDSGAKYWYDTRGTIAHEFGHFCNKDTTLIVACMTALNIIFIPIEIMLFLFALFCNITFSWIPLGGLLSSTVLNLWRLMFLIIRRLTEFVVFKILGLFGGKRQEIKADRFAVDLGFGAAIYAKINSLPDPQGIWNKIRMIFDEHPSNRRRCKLIRKRMIKVYGLRYWEDFQAEYATSNNYMSNEIAMIPYYEMKLDAKDRNVTDDAAVSLLQEYKAYDEQDIATLENIVSEQIREKYGSPSEYDAAFFSGDETAITYSCLLKACRIAKGNKRILKRLDRIPAK